MTGWQWHQLNHMQASYGPLSGSTRVSRYQKKHSSTQTHSAHQPSLSASSNYHKPQHHPCSIQVLCSTSNHVLFGLPLGLETNASYSIHFFTQSLSYFCNTCPYHHNMFCSSTNIMSTIPSLFLNSLFEALSYNLTPHIHPTILISAF